MGWFVPTVTGERLSKDQVLKSQKKEEKPKVQEPFMVILECSVCLIFLQQSSICSLSIIVES